MHLAYYYFLLLLLLLDDQSEKPLQENILYLYLPTYTLLVLTVCKNVLSKKRAI